MLLTTCRVKFGPSDCQAAGGSNTVFTANKAYTDKGPACFDVKDSLHASVLYHLPTFKGDNAIERGVLGGWWLGSLVSGAIRLLLYSYDRWLDPPTPIT